MADQEIKFMKPMEVKVDTRPGKGCLIMMLTHGEYKYRLCTGVLYYSTVLAAGKNDRCLAVSTGGKVCPGCSLELCELII